VVTPRIVYSPLGKCWYVVTRYREKEGVGLDGVRRRWLVASTKYDVTDQMLAILKQRADRPSPKARKQRS
jgi:hypothetical protein